MRSIIEDSQYTPSSQPSTRSTDASNAPLPAPPAAVAGVAAAPEAAAGAGALAASSSACDSDWSSSFELPPSIVALSERGFTDLHGPLSALQRLHAAGVRQAAQDEYQYFHLKAAENGMLSDIKQTWSRVEQLKDQLLAVTRQRKTAAEQHRVQMAAKEKRVEEERIAFEQQVSATATALHFARERTKDCEVENRDVQQRIKAVRQVRDKQNMEKQAKRANERNAHLYTTPASSCASSSSSLDRAAAVEKEVDMASDGDVHVGRTDETRGAPVPAPSIVHADASHRCRARSPWSADVDGVDWHGKEGSTSDVMDLELSESEVEVASAAGNSNSKRTSNEAMRGLPSAAALAPAPAPVTDVIAGATGRRGLFGRVEVISENDPDLLSQKH